MGAAGHFCEHGNLRYSCAECRAERRRNQPVIERKTYGRTPRSGTPLPPQPWRMDAALAAHEEAAVGAVTDAGGGVVVLPAPLGLRRVACALVRRLHNQHGNVLFLVPSANAAAAWADVLARDLNVPPEAIDDSGRNVQDWNRLRPITLWTPELLIRHASALRSRAPKLALFVDNPLSQSYSDVVALLALPFASRVGVAAARLGAASAAVSHAADALGGIVHRFDVADAMQIGLFRRARHRIVETEGDTDARARMVVDVLAAMKTGRFWVWVDDAATAHRVEEAASRRGMESRLLGGASSADHAARAARAVAEGAATVLITTPDAPNVLPGPVDAVVLAADTLGAAAASGTLIAQLAAGERPLEIVDLVPHKPGDGRETLALRLLQHATSFETSLPPLPWLRSALPVPALPDDMQDEVVRVSPEGWTAVQGLLADLLAEEWPEEAALAALADAYIASALDARAIPLGPLPAGDGGPDRAAGLAGPFSASRSLHHLALQLPEAVRVWSAFLDRDLPRVLTRHADAALLHHLVPDVRTLLLGTLHFVPPDTLRTLDPIDPLAAAWRAAAEGAEFDVPSARPVAPTGTPMSADVHRTHLLAGIAAERSHEIEESVVEIAQLSGAERQRTGRTLLDLVLVSKRRGDRGLELHYAPPAQAGRPRPMLPYTELNPGALIDVSLGHGYDPIARGTVAGIDAQEITVIIPDDAERRAPGREARIDQVANPRTFEILERAVRTLYGASDLFPGAGDIRGHLLAKAEARPGGGTLRLLSPRLNDPQKNAVGRALFSQPLTLIHGPPGTGKTTTLVELVRQAVQRGERVLVTADSNAAVDTIMEAYLGSGGIAVRTGPRPSLTRPSLTPNHIDVLSMRAPGVDWLRRVPVVFTTHVSSASLPRDMTFDRVVQDEASQATEPASCVSLLRAPRIVLAGDHLQLPPVVRSDEAKAQGYSVSLFERLHAAYGASLGRLLSVQYRMHPDIEAWSNRRFYGGRIETAVEPEPLQAAVRAGILPESPRAFFVDVAGRETARRTSKERVAEAEWIDEKVRALLGAGVRPEQIAVIAAYRAQVRLLRGLLAGTDVDVGTIDAFQGSERDLVIVSLVRGNPRGEVGFVREPRRLNVAVTRAKRHLLVVGDKRTLGADETLSSLLDSLAPLPA